MKQNKRNKIIITLISIFIIGIILVGSSVFFNMHNSKKSSGMNHETMNHADMMNSFSNDGESATMPGQDMFGAIGEIVELLNNNEDTDWSKVNINALREHLIDMDLLTTNTNVKETVLDNGMIFEVTSNDKRTVDAIQRMVPTHSNMILNNIWETKINNIENGITLQVTNNENKVKIQSLGFYGIMAYGGNHHQIHHMALAKGEMTIHK